MKKHLLLFLILTALTLSVSAQHHKLFRSNGLHITRSKGLRHSSNSFRGSHHQLQSHLFGSGFNHKEHQRQSKKYGNGFFKKLSDGRIRYHDRLTPAKKHGEMKGRYRVREWHPLTGKKRTWMQTVDHHGRVRRIRPEEGKNKHRYFDFNKHGKFLHPKQNH